MRLLGGVVLTAGAVVGSLCLLLALGGAMAGVRPLVFRSGSMGPEIPAGALGIARRADAPDLVVGDVVSVIAEDGTRVTHRIVEITGPAGPARFLTLRGDANPVPDQETYEVTSADRLMFSLPWLGYAITFLATPLGLILLGAACGGLLLFAFRPDPSVDPDRRGGRHRVAMWGAAPLALALVVVQSTPAAAVFTDSATLDGGPLVAGSLMSPTAAGTPCSIYGLPGLAQTATLRWTGVAATAATVPTLANYEYLVRAFDRTTGAQVGADQVVAHSGGSAALQQLSYSANLLGNIFGLNLFGDNRLRFDIRSRLIGAQWVGASVVSINLRAQSLLGLVNLSCE